MDRQPDAPSMALLKPRPHWRADVAGYDFSDCSHYEADRRHGGDAAVHRSQIAPNEGRLSTLR
jgi:hypothetical protein